MELSGKVFKVGNIQTGEGKNGKWQKQEIVIEQDGGKFTKKIAVQVWNELTKWDFQEGNDISFEADVESREYNGKWYTEIKAWKIN